MNVVVTGASKGIGKAVAAAFAAEGHQLFLCSRNEKMLMQTAGELGNRFPASMINVQACDLSEKAGAQEFGNWCLSKGTPDVLVNNAGLFEPGNVSDEADGAMERQMSTNLYSAYHLTRALLPSMVKQKSGHIFNVCSIAALKAYPNGGAYSISKFALHGFTINLRHEMKAHGIKVTAVHPGAVMTDSWAGFDNSQNRIMEAEDIAAMVLAATRLSIQACVEEIVIRPQLGDL